MALAVVLAGCGQAPGAAISPVTPDGAAPTFAIGPTASAERMATATNAAPAAGAQLRGPAGPTPGVWKLCYTLGDGPERHDELGLNFVPDGHVDLVGDGEAFTDFPYHWNDRQVSFEGLPRRDLLGGSGISRDRVAMTVESPTRMRGTVSLRVNYRWIAFPATAELVRADDFSGAIAVTPGTIVDTTEPEAFGD
jgi:hypothetical protein